MMARPLGVVAVVAVVAALLLAAGPVQAAEQPPQAPAEFRNGETNGFGSVAMPPYLDAGDGAVPVEARFVLHDLGTLHGAAMVLFAFNLKGDGAQVSLESLKAVGGQPIAIQRSTTVDGGRQPQVHVAPGDLLAAARDGRVDLVLRGQVEAESNGQVHVGAMAIAFDAAWRVLSTSDGPAQVYGFTMAMASGLPAGAMPFQGKGNAWLVLPFVLLAAVVLLAGGAALQATLRSPQPLAASPESFKGLRSASPRRVQVPVFGGPAPGPPVRRMAGPTTTAARTAPLLQGTRETRETLQGFPGSSGFPATPSARVTPARPGSAAAPAARGPLQGPLLPPHLVGPDPRRKATAVAPPPEAHPAKASRTASPKAPSPSTRRRVGRQASR